MTLWSFADFHETFLETSIWICKWVSWWCHNLPTCHIFCTYNLENSNILPKLVIVCSSYQDIFEQTVILHLFKGELRQVSHSHSWNMKFVSFLCTKWMENCEAMTSTHSFAYSYRLVKKCSLNICETSQCHNFLIFQLIFIKFSL